MSYLSFNNIPYEIIIEILTKTIKLDYNDDIMLNTYNKHNLIASSFKIISEYSLLSKNINNICNIIINNYDLKNFNPCSICLIKKVQVFYNHNKGSGECRFCWDYR